MDMVPDRVANKWMRIFSNSIRLSSTLSMTSFVQCIQSEVLTAISPAFTFWRRLLVYLTSLIFLYYIYVKPLVNGIAVTK